MPVFAGFCLQSSPAVSLSGARGQSSRDLSITRRLLLL